MTIVLPASMARTRAPALCRFSMVGRADRRHVEPHVLLGLGDLDEGPAAGPAEQAGALDAAVGPLDGLDGQGGLLLDGDRLADVEPAHLLGQQPAELDVLALRGRSGPRRVRIPSFTSSSGQ